jgi:hypothetical protein
LRGFAGDSHSDVLNAIRPDLSLAGLEKEFVLRGDKYILRKPLPMARLCGAKTHTWSFELWGHGELMHLGGGGREVHEVRGTSQHRPCDCCQPKTHAHPQPSPTARSLLAKKAEEP